VAMAKLWERSSIAKIALKRGVQLTTSERMAEEIKVIKHTWSTFLTSGSNSLLICTFAHLCYFSLIFIYKLQKLHVLCLSVLDSYFIYLYEI
jgi:hypothetical protein